MKRDDVIQLAKEAGVSDPDLSNEQSAVTDYGDATDALVRFAALVAAVERERCAKVCEDRGNRNRIAASLPNADRDEFYCADDIRALGDE